jgi:YhcH/YjgK/YiaL family protein
MSAFRIWKIHYNLWGTNLWGWILRNRCKEAIATAGSAHGANAAPYLRGKISEAEKYENLHPRFAKAFEFMRRPDLAELPCGRYEIDGSNCWAIVQEAVLKPFAEENKYEVHRAFIDIQSPISGSETFGVAKPDPKVFDGFDTMKDYVLFKAKGEPWILEPGEFAIFFPENGAHAAGLSSDGQRKIKKLVVKVCLH